MLPCSPEKTLIIDAQNSANSYNNTKLKISAENIIMWTSDTKHMEYYLFISQTYMHDLTFSTVKHFILTSRSMVTS